MVDFREQFNDKLMATIFVGKPDGALKHKVGTGAIGVCIRSASIPLLDAFTCIARY